MIQDNDIFILNKQRVDLFINEMREKMQDHVENSLTSYNTRIKVSYQPHYTEEFKYEKEFNWTNLAINKEGIYKLQEPLLNHIRKELYKFVMLFDHDMKMCFHMMILNYY